MTCKEALVSADIRNPDKELILAHVLGKSRTWIVAHPDAILTEEEEASFRHLCKRRRNHEPLAYITGGKEFYGRMFRVTPATLIPRPATEKLIEQAIAIMRGGNPEGMTEADEGIVIAATVFPDMPAPGMIVDVGTGSGCIAVTLACELPDVSVIATDISPDALAIAQENAQTHRVETRVTFREGNALEPVRDLARPFLLVSNPPYIPDGTMLEEDVIGFEPHDALFAGADGRAVIDRLIAQAEAHPYCCGYVIECRTEQVA